MYRFIPYQMSKPTVGIDYNYNRNVLDPAPRRGKNF